MSDQPAPESESELEKFIREAGSNPNRPIVFSDAEVEAFLRYLAAPVPPPSPELLEILRKVREGKARRAERE
jgi:hypothetical protein